MALRLAVATIFVATLAYVWHPLPVMIGMMVLGVAIWQNGATLTYTHDD